MRPSLFPTIVISFFLLTFIVTSYSGEPSSLMKRQQMDAYHQQFVVKLGTTTDAHLKVALSSADERSTQQQRTANHARTLRATVERTTIGVPRVVIESAKPQRYYVLSGDYAVSLETASLKWVHNTALSFQAVDQQGMPVSYVIDVHTGRVEKNALPKLILSSREVLADPD
jgi:hypothetical protein